MGFKERIKELREEKGLSQMALSKKTNISQSAIAKWELGKTEPTASALKLLAIFFEVSVDYLLCLTNDD
ncbi:MAG: helix-turn-helix transcriptional regulator [Clostridia bacterium]|nr:helix-turn-helix transcriptional regulator [Clostridia bacterium]